MENQNGCRLFRIMVFCDTQTRRYANTKVNTISGYVKGLIWILSTSCTCFMSKLPFEFTPSLSYVYKLHRCITHTHTHSLWSPHLYSCQNHKNSIEAVRAINTDSMLIRTNCCAVVYIFHAPCVHLNWSVLFSNLYLRTTKSVQFYTSTSVTQTQDQ